MELRLTDRSAILDLGYLGAAALAAPVVLVRALTDPRYRAHLVERFAFYPPRRDCRPALWIHGVSVGEILGGRTLIRSIAGERPAAEILLSTTTVTGRRAARQQYPGRRVVFFPFDLSSVTRRSLDRLRPARRLSPGRRVVFSPFDLSSVPRRSLDRLRPSLILLFELEIWPNLVLEATARGIPVAIVNGRITERSLRRYAPVRDALRPVLARIGPVCVQDETYAGRFRRLGVPPERIRITGNVKYDAIPEGDSRPDPELAALFGIDPTDWLWVGGSTHAPEERVLAETHRALKARHPRLRLILVPRHPERAGEVARALAGLGLDVRRRSEIVAGSPPPRDAVILVDTIGELGRIYTLAQAVFIGGSLIPHGGQNMLEPAALGRAVLFGPHVHNFRDAVEHLLRRGGALQVRDGVELAARLESLQSDPGAVRILGERARAAVAEGRGATRRTLEALAPLLDRLGPASGSFEGPPASGRGA